MPGEPNGDNSGEDTVEMIYYSYADHDRAKAGQWNDLDPNRNMAFMCSHQGTKINKLKKNKRIIYISSCPCQTCISYFF